MNKSIEPNDVFISEESTILQALEQLDQVGLQILFIVQNRKLVACVTDGDIRKAILAGKGLNTPISQVCNYKPVYLHITEQHKAKALIEEKCLKAIPVVDDKMEIETIIFAVKEQKLTYRSEMDVPVVMMAGGLGTRLFPYTKILPKPLLPIAETPISERIINSFREYGCQDFYMIVNYKKEMIKAYYNEISKDYKLTFVDESRPLGTGGGLKLMEGRIKSTFILTNCDILINDDFSKAYEYHKKEKSKATMICSLMNYKIPYGVVKFGVNGIIEEMQEKPTVSYFTNTGCYILEPEVLEAIPEGVEMGMPQILEKLQAEGMKVCAYPISENAWMDMGEMDSLERMTDKLENGDSK